jgi:thiol-disulfide isomerase/thioredoxin
MSPSSAQTNDTPVAPGTYTDYSESKVASTTGTKLLFFHAPWCPQCRALDQDIRASSLPSNTTIFKVDYDSNQALRQKYGVTLQTTIVSVDGGGNLLKKYVAYDKPTFANVKENVLE